MFFKKEKEEAFSLGATVSYKERNEKRYQDKTNATDKTDVKTNIKNDIQEIDYDKTIELEKGLEQYENNVGKHNEIEMLPTGYEEDEVEMEDPLSLQYSEREDSELEEVEKVDPKKEKRGVFVTLFVWGCFLGIVFNFINFVFRLGE